MKNRNISVFEAVIAALLIALIGILVSQMIFSMFGIAKTADQFNSDTFTMADSIDGNQLMATGKDYTIIIQDKEDILGKRQDKINLKEYVAKSESGEIRYFINDKESE